MPTFVHGKHTLLKVNAVDLSGYTDTTDVDRTKSTDVVTAYGPTVESDSFIAGLGTGKVTHAGTYATDAAGPAKTLEPLLEAGTVVAWIFQPAGAGTGKPQKTCNVIVTSFKTSHPVNGKVKWSCELTMSGEVDNTAQA
jgi:hypothetical protein